MGRPPIESAAYAKSVLFGKNADNFKTESEILIKYDGALIVENVCDLAYKIRKFMSDKKFLENIGCNALKAVKSQNGAVSFTVKK
ncbi:hypothetical protein AGMMS49953_02250 [Endomicrobiia bacterium]|nr:hypothetical protein AGMMS49953_02250 [Endomicrobiia bacterium]